MNAKAFLLLPMSLACASCARPSLQTPSLSTPASNAAGSKAQGARPASQPVTLRLLYTSDEHGWVAPTVEKGRARGGAPALLSRWVRDEGYCVPHSDRSCASSTTMALSGGDNWTGPALSSFFQGETAAEAMRWLGYTASALGNHELDFGRAVFEKNQRIEGFPYLAANVHPELSGGGLTKPFVLIERGGVRVGIIGLTVHNAPQEGIRQNYAGLEFQGEEEALQKSVPDVYAAGADAVVVIAHVCATELLPIVARHPEWSLGFVGAGHCHAHPVAIEGAAGMPVASPGYFLRSYVRALLTIDPNRPVMHRVLGAHAEIVDLTYSESEPPPVTPDRDFSDRVTSWQKRTDEALGEVVGYTNETLDAGSTQLTNLITDTWRETVHADAALLNHGATRQAIAEGPITKETIYSVMPFENNLVTMHLSGEALLANLACCHPHVSGLRKSANGVVEFDNGKPIDPKQMYTIVSTDYAYYGGSGFLFEQQDAHPLFSGTNWREPVLRWLRAHPTTAAQGLERLLDPQPRL